MRIFFENLGRKTVTGFEEIGYVSTLFAESLFWLFCGPRRYQPVSISKIFYESFQIGVQAIPIVAMLCFVVGIMLAIQGIETLKTFGAEGKVIIGIALSVTREFSPLIVGILVAGRSGSAITARIGTMQENQEVDALCVMGINPVRYLAVPHLVAMMVIVPVLTILGDFMGLLGGAAYTSVQLNINLQMYMNSSLAVLQVDDVMQGLIKSVVFAIIIALIGISNGFQVHGGAEGIGKATTRSVVMSISLVILADMVFTFFLNH